MNKPPLFIRDSIIEKDELECASNYFSIISQRTKLLPSNGQSLLARYSVLPYYDETYRDLENLGYFLLNSPAQHKWIANFDWYQPLKEFTPKTYFSLEDFMGNAPETEYVVKGRTNSRKFQWNTKMFAKTKIEARNIGFELQEDGLIQSQGVVYREFVPLVTYEVGIRDLPFSNEWRCFFYKNELVSFGYYWSIANKINYILPKEAIEFLKDVSKVASKYANFYVLDIAEKRDGGWTLIEVNDGQCSGLSCNLPENLYSFFANILCQH